MRYMTVESRTDNAWAAGGGIGLLFGLVNLLLTWLRPLDDDSPGALLLFYGPMFLAWALVSFRAARLTGRVQSGVTAGMRVAFATFCVYSLLVLLRVELFLADLTARSDWQGLVARFRESGVENLRRFVTLDYVKGLPLKIGVASVIGGAVGAMGGTLGSREAIDGRPRSALGRQDR